MKIQSSFAINKTDDDENDDDDKHRATILSSLDKFSCVVLQKLWVGAATSKSAWQQMIWKTHWTDEPNVYGEQEDISNRRFENY